VTGNGCISREETEFLQHANDLVELKLSGDGVATKLEAAVEDLLIRFWKGFREVCLILQLLGSLVWYIITAGMLLTTAWSSRPLTATGFQPIIRPPRLHLLRVSD